MLLFIVALLGLVGPAPKAKALLDTQGFVGYRKASLFRQAEPEEYSGLTLSGSFHVDPIPILPWSIGGVVNWSSLQAVGETQADSLRGIDFGVETEVWYPLTSHAITPYVKGGYTYYGRYQIRREGGLESWRPQGLYYGGGLRLYILFKLAFMAEVMQSSRTYRDSESSFKERSTTFLLGGQMGL